MLKPFEKPRFLKQK